MEKIENISQIERNDQSKRKRVNYAYHSIKWVVFLVFIGLTIKTIIDHKNIPNKF